MFTNGVVSLPGHEGMPVGRDVDFTWAGDGSPVDLALMRGPPASMNKVDDIALNVKGESNAAGQQSYKWTIPKDLPAGQYSASISQSG
ncbi:hypothetical protein MMC21_005640 [Puttea exsequens]|nr:hypothetical protein [Puttea exsequens]